MPSFESVKIKDPKKRYPQAIKMIFPAWMSQGLCGALFSKFLNSEEILDSWHTSCVTFAEHDGVKYERFMERYLALNKAALSAERRKVAGHWEVFNIF